MTEPTAAPSRTTQVIVGVDGSDTARRAVGWAAQHAARHGARLHIVSCYSLPVYGEPGAFAAYAVQSQVDAIKADHDAYVAEAVSDARRAAPDVAITTDVVFASPITAVPQMAAEGDTVVVGATGRSRFFADVLGSTATAVCHHARVPVVVVPAANATSTDTEGATMGATMKKIVVGIDGSPESQAAADWAYDEAARAGATLVAVHGWTYPYPVWGEEGGAPGNDMRGDAERLLGVEVRNLQTRHIGGTVAVESQVIEESPAKALMDAAADADLLVVGSRGRGGFASLLLGSVSRTVVQHAACPVAVIRHRTD